jgi:hypothetical protein
VNSMNDSCKDGRDSWLVNFVFGKIEEVVVAAKLCLQAEEVLLALDTLFSVAGKLRSGVGQQPLRHSTEPSFRQDDCIFWWFSSLKQFLESFGFDFPFLLVFFFFDK